MIDPAPLPQGDVSLAGELTLQLADRIETKRAGEVAFARRGVHHTFVNLSEAPAS